MKSSRKRNVARKAKNASPEAGSREPESGTRFVPQNAHPPTSGLHHSPPEAGIREPEAGTPFVPQNAHPPTSGLHHSPPEAGSREPEAGLSIQRHAVLRDEDPAAYAQLLSELRVIYEPRSAREALAVEDLAQCRWALARFDQAEAVCLQKLTDGFNDPVAFEGDEIIGAGESLGHAATVHVEYDDKDRRYVEPDTQFPAFDKIHRYRTHWERKHARALAEFDRAQRARHLEANQKRAEAQAQRQAEAHALKQELALAREVRQQELHALRIAAFKAKQPTAPPNPDPVTQAETENAHENAHESAALAYLESLLNGPAPMTEQDFLRMRSAQPENGFVSQNQPASQSPAPNAPAQAPEPM